MIDMNGKIKVTAGGAQVLAERLGQWFRRGGFFVIEGDGRCNNGTPRRLVRAEVEVARVDERDLVIEMSGPEGLIYRLPCEEGWWITVTTTPATSTMTFEWNGGRVTFRRETAPV